jgi:hypothetical protein
MRVLLLITAVSILAATITAMFSSIPLPQSVSAATTTTTTKNANFLTYQNSTYGVKIQYSSSWGVQTGVSTLDENGNLVQPIDIADIAPPIESDPNAVAYFQIGLEQQLTPADTKKIDLYLRNIINSYRFNSTDFSIVSATTHATLAGKQAYSLVFTDTYQGFPTKTMIRGIVNGRKIIIFSLPLKQPNLTVFFQQYKK